MDVSNSTGQDTGYRVLGAGGTQPDPKKLKDGQTEIEIKGKKFVQVDKVWHEVLHQGTLEAWTYVTVKPRKRPFLVEFLRADGSVRGKVPEETQTTAAAAQPTDYLVVLVQNGKSTAKTCVCRRKKP